MMYSLFFLAVSAVWGQTLDTGAVATCIKGTEYSVEDANRCPPTEPVCTPEGRCAVCPDSLTKCASLDDITCTSARGTCVNYAPEQADVTACLVCQILEDPTTTQPPAPTCPDTCPGGGVCSADTAFTCTILGTDVCTTDADCNSCGSADTCTLDRATQEYCLRPPAVSVTFTQPTCSQLPADPRACLRNEDCNALSLTLQTQLQCMGGRCLQRDVSDSFECATREDCASALLVRDATQDVSSTLCLERRCVRPDPDMPRCQSRTDCPLAGQFCHLGFCVRSCALASCPAGKRCARRFTNSTASECLTLSYYSRVEASRQNLDVLRLADSGIPFAEFEDTSVTIASERDVVETTDFEQVRGDFLFVDTTYARGDARVVKFLGAEPALVGDASAGRVKDGRGSAVIAADTVLTDFLAEHDVAVAVDTAEATFAQLRLGSVPTDAAHVSMFVEDEGKKLIVGDVQVTDRSRLSLAGRGKFDLTQDEDADPTAPLRGVVSVEGDATLVGTVLRSRLAVQRDRVLQNDQSETRDTDVAELVPERDLFLKVHKGPDADPEVRNAFRIRKLRMQQEDSNARIALLGGRVELGEMDLARNATCFFSGSGRVDFNNVQSARAGKEVLLQTGILLQVNSGGTRLRGTVADFAVEVEPAPGRDGPAHVFFDEDGSLDHLRIRRLRTDVANAGETKEVRSVVRQTGADDSTRVKMLELEASAKLRVYAASSDPTLVRSDVDVGDLSMGADAQVTFQGANDRLRLRFRKCARDGTACVADRGTRTTDATSRLRVDGVELEGRPPAGAELRVDVSPTDEQGTRRVAVGAGRELDLDDNVVGIPAADRNGDGTPTDGEAEPRVQLKPNAVLKTRRSRVDATLDFTPGSRVEVAVEETRVPPLTDTRDDDGRVGKERSTLRRVRVAAEDARAELVLEDVTREPAFDGTTRTDKPVGGAAEIVDQVALGRRSKLRIHARRKENLHDDTDAGVRLDRAWTDADGTTRDTAKIEFGAKTRVTCQDCPGLPADSTDRPTVEADCYKAVRLAFKHDSVTGDRVTTDGVDFRLAECAVDGRVPAGAKLDLAHDDAYLARLDLSPADRKPDLKVREALPLLLDSNVVDQRRDATGRPASGEEATLDVDPRGELDTLDSEVRVAVKLREAAVMRARRTHVSEKLEAGVGARVEVGMRDAATQPFQADTGKELHLKRLEVLPTAGEKPLIRVAHDTARPADTEVVEVEELDLSREDSQLRIDADKADPDSTEGESVVRVGSAVLGRNARLTLLCRQALKVLLNDEEGAQTRPALADDEAVDGARITVSRCRLAGLLPRGVVVGLDADTAADQEGPNARDMEVPQDGTLDLREGKIARGDAADEARVTVRPGATLRLDNTDVDVKEVLVEAGAVLETRRQDVDESDDAVANPTSRRTLKGALRVAPGGRAEVHGSGLRSSAAATGSFLNAGYDATDRAADECTRTTTDSRLSCPKAARLDTVEATGSADQETRLVLDGAARVGALTLTGGAKLELRSTAVRLDQLTMDDADSEIEVRVLLPLTRPSASADEDDAVMDLGDVTISAGFIKCHLPPATDDTEDVKKDALGRRRTKLASYASLVEVNDAVEGEAGVRLVDADGNVLKTLRFALGDNSQGRRRRRGMAQAEEECQDEAVFVDGFLEVAECYGSNGGGDGPTSAAASLYAASSSLWASVVSLTVASVLVSQSSL